MPRKRYPSDEQRLRQRPAIRVHLTVATHRRTAAVWANPSKRGMLVELWRQAAEAFAGRTGGRVVLGPAAQAAITGVAPRFALARLRELCAELGYVLEEGPRAPRKHRSRAEQAQGLTVAVTIRNFAKKQGWHSATWRSRASRAGAQRGLSEGSARAQRGLSATLEPLDLGLSAQAEPRKYAKDQAPRSATPRSSGAALRNSSDSDSDSSSNASISSFASALAKSEQNTHVSAPSADLAVGEASPRAPEKPEPAPAQVGAEAASSPRRRAQAKRSAPEPSPTARELTELLASEIKRVQPTARVPTDLGPWAREMDRLLRLDGREPEQVRRAVAWIFGPNQQAEASFVVLSPQALRAKWDRMVAVVTQQRKRARERAPAQQRESSAAATRGSAYTRDRRDGRLAPRLGGPELPQERREEPSEGFVPIQAAVASMRAQLGPREPVPRGPRGPRGTEEPS